MEELTLRQLRRAKERSQQAVADFMGVSAATIARWEEDPTKIAIGDCFKLCEFFEVPYNATIFMPK